MQWRHLLNLLTVYNFWLGRGLNVWFGYCRPARRQGELWPASQVFYNNLHPGSFCGTISSHQMLSWFLASFKKRDSLEDYKRASLEDYKRDSLEEKRQCARKEKRQSEGLKKDSLEKETVEKIKKTVCKD